MRYRPYAEQNVDIFWDTIRMIHSNRFLNDSISNTIAGTEAYSHKEKLPNTDKARFKETAEVVVSNKRTYQAAMDSVDSEYRTAVLNFANAFTPGGGVLHGSGAQEESLCRCSTLYPCLNNDLSFDKYYHYNNEHEFGVLGSHGLFYSPDIIIIKTDESVPKRLKPVDWVKTDVITCAAPHLYSSDATSEYVSTMRIRIRRILELAALRKVDNLILGAFGCGAFNNPPEIVAELFKEELGDFKYTFKRVEFAVMGFDDNPNYLTFKKTFR